MAMTLAKMESESRESKPSQDRMSLTFINGKNSSIMEVCEVQEMKREAASSQFPSTLRLSSNQTKVEPPLPDVTEMSHQVCPPTPTPPVPTKKRSQYPIEQVDWIRYQKEDCCLDWAAITSLFQEKFPGAKHERKTLISLHFRDNVLPQLDAQGRVVWDRKVLYTQLKVRDKQTADGVPYLLTERKPKSALAYAWVSEEHKRMASKVLDENQETEKGRWRKAIEEAADLEKLKRRRRTKTEKPTAENQASNIIMRQS